MVDEYLGVVGLEEKDVVVEDLDEQLRVDPSSHARVRNLQRALKALQHAARVPSAGRLLQHGSRKRAGDTFAKKKPGGDGSGAGSV